MRPTMFDTAFILAIRVDDAAVSCSPFMLLLGDATSFSVDLGESCFLGEGGAVCL